MMNVLRETLQEYRCREGTCSANLGASFTEPVWEMPLNFHVRLSLGGFL
jgi:hypothetical protein